MKVANLGEAPDRDLWARAVKAGVVILCGVIPAIVLGMNVVWSLVAGFNPPRETFGFGLFGALLICGPAALYAAMIHTKVPVVFFGLGLVAIEAWSVWNALTSESSTAGLVLIWIPLAGVPFVVLGWAVDVWVRAGQPLSPPS